MDDNYYYDSGLNKDNGEDSKEHRNDEDGDRDKEGLATSNNDKDRDGGHDMTKKKMVVVRVG
jgi:hypothetical protein